MHNRRIDLYRLSGIAIYILKPLFIFFCLATLPKIVNGQPNISLWRVDDAHLQDHNQGITYLFACGDEYYITYEGAGTYENINIAILNDGDQPLELTLPLALAPASGYEFEITVQPDKTSLQPGEETHFTIQYTAPDSYTGTEVSISVNSNDPDSPACTVNLDVGVVTATTLAATAIGTTTATLNGTIFDAGATVTVKFNYGLTVAYGTDVTADQSPLNAPNANTAVSKTITSLTPNTTYHFRVRAENGGITNGADMTFTTNAAPEIDVQRPALTSIADGTADALGNKNVGMTTVDYTIDNTAGTAQLDVTAVTATNLTNVSVFGPVTGLPLNIAAGATAILQIAFVIDAVGAFSFDMDITNNDGDEDPYDIAVSGTGIAPEIDVKRPASIADGAADALGINNVGMTTVTYTIDNTAGTAQLDVNAVTATNLTNVSNFGPITGLPLNIAAGATATLQIAFVIDAVGAFSFDMDIANNDGDENPYDIDVSGTGGNMVPEIDVQRPALTSIADGGADALGNKIVGMTTVDYTIDNTAGTAQLDVTAVTATNLVNVSNFGLTTMLPLNIAAGATAILQIAFAIDAAGPFSFDMDITNNDSNENPYDIAVSGTGIAPEIDVQRPALTSIADGAADALGITLWARQQ